MTSADSLKFIGCSSAPRCVQAEILRYTHFRRRAHACGKNGVLRWRAAVDSPGVRLKRFCVVSSPLHPNCYWFNDFRWIGLVDYRFAVQKTVHANEVEVEVIVWRKNIELQEPSPYISFVGKCRIP